MAESDGHIRIHTNSFQGGASISKKLGIANSYYYSQSLDNRSDPSQLSVLPGPRTIASNLTDLITAIDQDLNGVRWGIGSNGGVYAINASNVISKRAQLTEQGAAGILYNQVTDQLYIPGQTAVSMYGQATTGITGNPVFRPNQFAQSASTANGCVNLYNSADGFYDGAARNNVQSLGVGITQSVINQGLVTTYATATYSVPTSLNESVGSFCFFAPDIEPFYSIQVYIAGKGTGNWTLTLHDSLNNQLAQVAVANGSLTSNAYNEFKFSGPIRGLVNASQTGKSAAYHWHITSTAADGTVGTIVAGDLSTADFLLFAYRLVQTKNGWHPCNLFTGGGVPMLCIGNGNYLATYNFGNDSNPTNSQFQRHNLVFKQGYEVCGVDTWNQYEVIAVERRSANSTRNVQEGALYLWDGTTSAPSIFVKIPMGAPQGMHVENGVVYFTCNGSIYAYSGGSTVIKVRKLAYQNTDYLNAYDTTIVNPNMMCSRYGVLMMGYPSSTTNNNINFGVWSWGTVELTFPNSYCLSYVLANGQLNNTGTNNLQIGCVYNFVDTMYISWQYTDSGGVTHYGVDVIDNFCTSSTSFSWQSLVYDGGVSYKIKQAARVKISCRSLPSGYTLQAGYSLDGGAWVWSPSANVGDAGVIIDVNKRFHEIQYGFQGTSTGSLTPLQIVGTTIDIDPLPAETQLIANQ
jgi:hypothetical protein